MCCQWRQYVKSEGQSTTIRLGCFRFGVRRRCRRDGPGRLHAALLRGADVAVGVDHARSLAHRARQLSDYSIGELACFNVDLAREFRYCLENDRDPTAGRGVSTREPARITQARENQCALPCAVVWCHQPPDLACTCELILVGRTTDVCGYAGLGQTRGRSTGVRTPRLSRRTD